MPDDIRGTPLDQLSGRAGQPGSVNAHDVQLEFQRRQTLAQQEAAAAMIATADATKRNARYLLWSVVILAVSSVGSLILDWLAYQQVAR